MSAVAAVATQAALTQLNLSMSLAKKAHEAEGQFIEMIAASIDMTRAQNLDISV